MRYQYTIITHCEDRTVVGTGHVIGENNILHVLDGNDIVASFFPDEGLGIIRGQAVDETEGQSDGGE